MLLLQALEQGGGLEVLLPLEDADDVGDLVDDRVQLRVRLLFGGRLDRVGRDGGAEFADHFVEGGFRRAGLEGVRDVQVDARVALVAVVDVGGKHLLGLAFAPVARFVLVELLEGDFGARGIEIDALDGPVVEPSRRGRRRR